MRPGMAIVRADEPYTGEGARDLGRGEAPPSGPGDLAAVFNARALNHGPKHDTQSEVIDVYNGNIPARFADLFHEEQRVHLVNMLRLAADDLAGMAGQEFPLYFPPENDTPTAKDRAEKRETVCYGYNAAGQRNGGVSMKGVMAVNGFYLVTTAEAVFMVLPDYRRKTPYFTFRDPRTHFPPIGWNPWEQSDLDGTMFAYRLPLAEIKRRWPAAAAELDYRYSKSTHVMSTGWRETATLHARSGSTDEEVWLWIGEYYHSDAWYISTLEDRAVTLVGSEAGLDKGHPNVCPVVGAALFNPEVARSGLADQISIQVAESRLFSQQIDHADRTTYPATFGTPLVGGRAKWGPGAYNEFDTSKTPGEKPAFYQAAPPNPIASREMMQFGVVLLRMLNRNPESFQGQGDADSAKAITELKAGVSSTVQNNMWPSFMEALPQLYGKAMRMDQTLWGADRKRISGRTPDVHASKRGLPVQTSYRPIADLAGYEDDCQIEPGILLRGYQGRLEIMQLVQSGLISEDTALEQLDVVRDPQEEKRRIKRGRMEALQLAEIEMAAQQNRLQPGAIPKLVEMMAKESVEFFEALRALDEKGEFYVPPAPPEQQVPGLPAGPGGGGLPPELAAALGSGPPRPLQLVRGGRSASA